jgi:hypothetical protein
MKFRLLKIGGGYHPVIRVVLNGRECNALIDTGANRTVLTNPAGDAYLIINKINYLISGDWVKSYPDPSVMVIIGNDILIREGAVINYPKQQIVFIK